MNTFFSVIKACAHFVFGSKETTVGKGVILARFKVYLLRKGGFNGAADEIEEEARLKRELRSAEIRAKTRKQRARMVQDEMIIDKGLEILEQRRAGRESKRVEIVDRQHDCVGQLQNSAEQQRALDDLNRQRDDNARDAAEYLRAAESVIRIACGKVSVDSESLRAIDALVQFAKLRAEEAKREAEAAKRQSDNATAPATPATPADEQSVTTVRRSKVRISELSKELGVPSKSIIAKCLDEGIPAEMVKSHASAVPIGLALSIKEWFNEPSRHSGSASMAPIDIEKPSVQYARPKRKISTTIKSDDSEG